MSGNTYNGLQYATGGDPAAIHTISLNLATTTNPRVIGSFADTTARDTACAADIAAGQVGMKCWIVNRSGHCTYTGSTYGWRWDPQRNLIVDAYRSANADSGINNPVGLLDPAPYVLPAGNRRVEIYINSDVINLGTVNGCPRLYDSISGRGIRGFVPAGNNQVTVQGFLPSIVVAGTLDMFINGNDLNNANQLRWTGSYVQAFDCGPE